jgi:soluble lytic murein transglycosylase-like protein
MTKRINKNRALAGARRSQAQKTERSRGFARRVGAGLCLIFVPILLAMKFEPGMVFGNQELSFNPHDAYRAVITKAIMKFRPGYDQGKVDEISASIISESRANGFDPLLITSLVYVESAFKTGAVSPKGAVGLLQVTPLVGRDLAEEMDIRWAGRSTLLHTGSNIKLGVRYLGDLNKSFGDIRQAIIAYNFGPSYVNNAIKNGKRLPVNYPDKVLKLYAELCEEQP